MDVGVNDFEDIAVYFSEEEWGCLREEQKRLYKEVMMENFTDVCSLGSFYLKPELISKIEGGKEPCVRDRTLHNGETPINCVIIKPDILAQLPEVSPDDDESDCIYLEIDSDSDQERGSSRSDASEIEDDDLSDCVYLGPEVSLSELRIQENGRNALDCIYVDSEDGESVEEETETGAADMEEEEEEEEDDDDYDDEDGLSDCYCVEPDTTPKIDLQKRTLVKCEDQSEKERAMDGDDQVTPGSDPPLSAHCLPWESKMLNGASNDRIIEDTVIPINHTTIKNKESPSNTLLNVWYVKRIETDTTSHQEVVVPGSPRIEQHKNADSPTDAALDQITDLEFLCPLCPEMFTSVSKFFDHQKVHEPKTPVCPECGARFSDNHALERHLLLHIEEKIHVCQECGLCFNTRLMLETHLKTHKGDRQWQCPECGKFLFSKSGLERHKLLHVRDKPVPCPQCGKCFIKQSNFEMHMRLHAGEEFYPCTKCEKLFSLKSACERHIRDHTKVRPHGCPQCGKRFLYNGCLIKHMRVHTGEKPFVCSDCGKRFGQSSSLNTHKRLHEDEKPYVCLECKKCFTKKFIFEVHLKIHAKEKLLAEIAQMKSGNVSDLVVPSIANNQCEDPIKDDSGNPDMNKPDEQPLVDGSLTNGQHLHEKPGVDSSLGDDPFHKKLLTDGSLKEEPHDDIPLNESHIRDVTISGGPYGVVPSTEGTIGSLPFSSRPVIDVSFNGRPIGEVPFKKKLPTDVPLNDWPPEDRSSVENPYLDFSSSDQSIGDGSFLQTSYYSHDPDSVSLTERSMLDVPFFSNPINSGAEETQHVCPDCGKVFPYNGSLVKHLLTHTGEKSYACTDCGKCFSQTSTLNCHKRTHTGERPYLCPQCGKGFTSQSHLTRHRIIHNVNRSFICTGCGKVFLQRSYLLKHQKRMTCS